MGNGGHTELRLGWMPAIIRFLGYDPQPIARTIGEALKRHRTGQALTQQELARRLDVDPSDCSMPMRPGLPDSTVAGSTDDADGCQTEETAHYRIQPSAQFRQRLTRRRTGWFPIAFRLRGAQASWTDSASESSKKGA